MERWLIASSALLWVVLLLNLLLTLALVRRANNGASAPTGKSAGGLEPGDGAPDFSAELIGGGEVTPASYAGREVAFLFMSPHCGPCRDVLPAVNGLWPKAERAGVELVLVSVADVAATATFVDEHDIRMPVLLAPENVNPLFRDYKIPGTPWFCLLDQSGRVRSTGHLSPDWGEWKALADRWDKHARTRAVGLAPGRER